ncbi:magnesium/cobalt transporter CorA [Megalodesulfovibrio paquesii]
MFEYLRQHRSKAGKLPGTVEYVGEKPESRVRITAFKYSDTEVAMTEPESLEACATLREPGKVVWLNMDGVHCTGFIEEAGRIFHLHPLILEDIAHTEQRPKMEDMGDYLFVVVKTLRFDEAEARVIDEQVSFVLGDGYLLSFQEEAQGDVFGDIRARIQTGKGKLRKLSADYLLYSLLDAVVDNYFVVLEKVGDAIEDMEEALLEAAGNTQLEELHALRREALFLRKYVWPLREIVARLERQESDLIQDGAKIYLRDLYDHVIQAMDTIETFRDVLSGMADLHLSKISLKLNEIMKVLTVISTFFIPLTFIAGVYGMNFRYMPELEWRWGYYAVLGAMVVIVAVMWIFFKKRNLL